MLGVDSFRKERSSEASMRTPHSPYGNQQIDRARSTMGRCRLLPMSSANDRARSKPMIDGRPGRTAAASPSSLSDKLARVCRRANANLCSSLCGILPKDCQ